MYIMGLSKGLNAVQQTIDEGLLKNRTVGFVGTAGETSKNPYFVDESRQRLTLLGLTLVEIDISSMSSAEIKDALAKVDAIYVAGGNSFWLLQQMQKKGLVEYVAALIKSGLPYFGESAGAVLLSETIEPAKTIDEYEDAPKLKGYKGLGLIDFFILPHVDREKYFEVFKQFIDENIDSLKIVKIRDDQAVLTRDGVHYEFLPSTIEPI